MVPRRRRHGPRGHVHPAVVDATIRTGGATVSPSPSYPSANPTNSNSTARSIAGHVLRRGGGGGGGGERSDVGQHGGAHGVIALRRRRGIETTATAASSSRSHGWYPRRNGRRNLRTIPSRRSPSSYTPVRHPHPSDVAVERVGGGLIRRGGRVGTGPVAAVGTKVVQVRRALVSGHTRLIGHAS